MGRVCAASMRHEFQSPIHLISSQSDLSKGYFTGELKWSFGLGVGADCALGYHWYCLWSGQVMGYCHALG